MVQSVDIFLTSCDLNKTVTNSAHWDVSEMAENLVDGTFRCIFYKNIEIACKISLKMAWCAIGFISHGVAMHIYKRPTFCCDCCTLLWRFVLGRFPLCQCTNYLSLFVSDLNLNDIRKLSHTPFVIISSYQHRVQQRLSLNYDVLHTALPWYG